MIQTASDEAKLQHQPMDTGDDAESEAGQSTVSEVVLTTGPTMNPDDPMGQMAAGSADAGVSRRTTLVLGEKPPGAPVNRVGAALSARGCTQSIPAPIVV